MQDFIKTERALFYYCFEQHISSTNGRRVINPGNKITIRKNLDFKNNGYEILIYNTALSSSPELCDGIRYTEIVEDTNVDCKFYGKGVSGNGVPLNNRQGIIFWKKGVLQIGTKKIGTDSTYIYKNCLFESEGSDFFNPTDSDISRIVHFMETAQDTKWNEFSVWFKKNLNQKKVSDKKQKTYILSVLSDIEIICDKQANIAFKFFKNKDEKSFNISRDIIKLFTEIYFILYRLL